MIKILRFTRFRAIPVRLMANANRPGFNPQSSSFNEGSQPNQSNQAKPQYNSYNQSQQDNISQKDNQKSYSDIWNQNEAKGQTKYGDSTSNRNFDDKSEKPLTERAWETAKDVMGATSNVMHTIKEKTVDAYEVVKDKASDMMSDKAKKEDSDFSGASGKDAWDKSPSAQNYNQSSARQGASQFSGRQDVGQKDQSPNMFKSEDSRSENRGFNAQGNKASADKDSDDKSFMDKAKETIGETVSNVKEKLHDTVVKAKEAVMTPGSTADNAKYTKKGYEAAQGNSADKDKVFSEDSNVAKKK